MEVLQGPVTVGLATETTAVSLTYSTKATPMDALRGATDCQETNEGCAHVLPARSLEWTIERMGLRID
jgi:hypothetical protein